MRCSVASTSRLLGVALAFAPRLASAEPAEPTAADRAVETLRAANVARSQDADEARAWAEEKARLELVLETVRQRTKRLKAGAEEDRAAVAELRREARALTPEDARTEALAELLAQAAERIHDALDAIDARAMPGAVRDREEDPGAEPLARLSAALNRLEAAEASAKAVTVELVSGELDGEPRSVELLRVGGAVGWWCGLDGQEAGLARVASGALTLEAVGEPAAEAIFEACRIAKGRRAPAMLPLPVAHARWSEAGAR